MNSDGVREAAAAAQRIVGRLERIQIFLELDSMRLESNEEIIRRRRRGELVPHKCDPGMIRVEDVLTGSGLLDLAKDWDLVLPHMLKDEKSAFAIVGELGRRIDRGFEELMKAWVKDPRSGLAPEDQQTAILDSRIQELVRHWYDKKVDGDLWWKGMLSVWRGIATRLKSIPGIDDDTSQLVTLDQMAARIKKKKRTLEGWKTKDSDFPLPAVEGGGGRADLYYWPRAVEYLRKKSGIQLPDRITETGSSR